MKQLAVLMVLALDCGGQQLYTGMPGSCRQFIGALPDGSIAAFAGENRTFL